MSIYISAIILGYLTAGGLKFLIRSIQLGNIQRNGFGMGGMPSTHTTIVSSVAFMVGRKEGYDTALFGIAAALVFIVIIDAMDLRKKIESHAVALNKVNPNFQLRSRIGHSAWEVVGGLVTGFFVCVVIEKATS